VFQIELQQIDVFQRGLKITPWRVTAGFQGGVEVRSLGCFEKFRSELVLSQGFTTPESQAAA
jgi:hypothetical protein